MNSTPTPALRGQDGARTAFRIGGTALVLIGVLTLGWGITNVFGYDGYDAPEGKYIAAFLGGLPIIAVGLMLLQAGYLGAAARYSAGETMPVVKDSASFLSDGEGVLGIGRTVDDQRTPAAAAATSGPYCRSCGQRNDGDARFCDGCGTSLA